MASQLTLTNLALSAERPLVTNLSLTLTRGRTQALVGASGSGKSLTCLALLNALPSGITQTSGHIMLNGAAISGNALRGKQVATVLQNPRTAFNALRTMGFHLQESRRALGLPLNNLQAEQVLDEVGLVPERTLPLYPFEMSGGMLQRMMLAIALLSEAPFLVADEPTTDLDTVAQARCLDLLEQIIARHNLGLLLVTHDMGVVARLADEVTVMSQGEVVEQGCVTQIFSYPQHPSTRQLISGHLALYGMELPA